MSFFLRVPLMVIGFLCFVVFAQERFYFGDDVLPCFESGVPLLKKRLQQLPDSENVGRQFAFVSVLHFTSLFAIV